MLNIYDLLTTAERKLKKKPFTPSCAREVFAYILWLAFDLLFKDDFFVSNVKEKVSEDGQQARREIRAERIQLNIRFTNALFKKATGSRNALILREDVPGFFTKLPTRCTGSKDFPARIQSLGSIFEVDLRPLKSIVAEVNPKWGSIRLLEK